ncbi:replication factor C subunit 4 isoform X2 [Patella vulgata]|uniref:replication factor C subunit 4 isoform X2 n=1 Tax=Patella vulgata TaxID=6465 RepID=UPI0024A99905|nr:replication factor C subunit 4 isoform X2 [Patella vulgata]
MLCFIVAASTTPINGFASRVIPLNWRMKIYIKFYKLVEQNLYPKITNMQAFLKGGSCGLQKAKDKPTTSSSKDTTEKRKHTPWVEKYRPRCVEDVAFQDEVVLVLKKSLSGSDLPNLLFYGPPGTGKTSTILAAARELYGPELFKSRILELNASDERGIDVVRTKVKNFSQLTAAGSRSDGKPCPPFKIVILDEADSMTGAAQAALRRTMEKQSRTTRFCLICNYVSRIIEPITSRCAKFRFKPLAQDVLSDRLKLISKKENITLSDEVIQALIDTSEGDLRKAITYLQSASSLHQDETQITQSDIFEISGIVPTETIDDVLKTCQSDSYEKLDTVIKLMINEGYAATQVINQLHDRIVISEELTDTQKSVICEKIALSDKCLMDGADGYLQLMALFSVVMTQICHGK